MVMRKMLFAVAALVGVSAAHADEQIISKPPVAAPVQGTHCNFGAVGGSTGGPYAYDSHNHLMQCAGDTKNPTWQYVPESSDADRIARKLDELNATETQILVKLTELVAAQQADGRK